MSKYKKLCLKAEMINEEFKAEGDKSRASVIQVGTKYRIVILKVLNNKEIKKYEK